VTLPTFIVIGAMKAGTTSLHQMLDAAPSIHMAPGKELDFFVEQKAWGRGPQWYGDQFCPDPGVVVVGESSPNYTKRDVFPGVPERMAEMLPTVRLVYVLRDPIARVISHYQHHVAQRGRFAALADVAMDDRYVLPSDYAHQLDAYLDRFDRSQILLITSEHLRRAPAAALAAIFDFLGVPPSSTDAPHVTTHRSVDKSRPRFSRPAVQRVARGVQRLVPGFATVPVEPAPPLPVDVRRALEDRFRPMAERLATCDVLGFDGWGLL
jgi:hypothetical protein